MTSANLGENKVEWSRTVDGQPVSLSAGIKGSLDNEGGSVKFLQTDTNILTASGTDNFAYSGFKNGVMAMGETDVFTFADSEHEVNLSFRERKGYAHDG